MILSNAIRISVVLLVSLTAGAQEPTDSGSLTPSTTPVPAGTPTGPGGSTSAESAPTSATNARPSPRVALNKSTSSTEPISFSLRHMFKTGKWPMWLLAALSLLGIALVIYFFTVLRMRNITPPRFLSDIEGMITAGRLNDARKACLRNKSPAAAVTLAAVEYVDKAEELEPQVLLENIESEGVRQATAIQNNLRYLSDIAQVAPMIGLLGTVLGMFTAFSGISEAAANPVELANGVGQALITTAAGLCIGIPAMMFYSYFRNRASRLLSNLEIVGTDLLNLLVSQDTRRNR